MRPSFRWMALRFGFALLIASTSISFVNCSAAKADVGEDARQADVIRHVQTSEKAVAITFDDGPSATFTPQILKLLREHHASATFFVIGSRIQRYPTLIREELKDGDEVANHSYSHELLVRVPASRVESELLQEQAAMVTVTGHEAAHLFRPPRGRFDKSILIASSKNNYKIILWSIDSRDWSNPGTDRIVSKVLKDVKSGDILLFHDQGGNRSQTIAALSGIIPELARRGYKMVTVSELLRLGQTHPAFER